MKTRYPHSAWAPVGPLCGSLLPSCFLQVRCRVPAQHPECLAVNQTASPAPSREREVLLACTLPLRDPHAERSGYPFVCQTSGAPDCSSSWSVALLPPTTPEKERPEKQ